MRKFTALLLACFMAVCTASCSDKKDVDNTADTGTTNSAPVGTLDPSVAGPGQNGPSVSLPAEAAQVIRDFAESSVVGDVDTVLACMYPKSSVEILEQSGVKQEFAVVIGNNLGGKLLGMSTDSCRKLGAEALQGAKKYYDTQDTNKTFTVSDGYELNMNVEIESNGQKLSSKDIVSVVMVDGEGWKLVPTNEQELIGLLDTQAQGVATQE